MRCIFCKADSTQSISREHIVPESIGNSTQVLARGVVCDQCNNYFARKVEKPFLEHPSIVALRCGEGLENKRGRIPPVGGILLPNYPALVHREFDAEKCVTHVTIPTEAFKLVAEGYLNKLVVPIGGDPPRGKILSRFLAKIAVEAMAQRLLHDNTMLNACIDDPQLDQIRAHAREGHIDEWPVNVRRIYSADRCVSDGILSAGQTVHEYDFLGTQQHEMYFVLAIFGMEMSINVAGPSIEGYQAWLEANNGASPLYHGKNASAGPWEINPPDT